jgi:uncharacterized protein YecT (DUF1311 family)
MVSWRRCLAIFRLMAAFGLLMAAAMVMNAAAQQSVPPPPGKGAPVPVPAVFQDRIPVDQLAALKQFEGMQSGKAMKDKQFHELLRGVVPDCDVHYGWDMPLMEVLDAAMEGSKIPVQIRDERYLIVSGRNGSYLDGLIWIDLQEGIALGGFYFYPTNSEPTPTEAIFSRQVQTEERSIGMGQLPAAFADDLRRWSEGFRVPAITTRYFLTGSNLRVLLEHDEDYCRAAPGTPGAARPGAPGSQSKPCEKMNASAADIDLETAYYLQQVNYKTNAAAWMIVSREQEDWIEGRDNACKTGPDPLACQIRMTREQTHVVLKQDTSPRIAYY